MLRTGGAARRSSPQRRRRGRQRPSVRRRPRRRPPRQLGPDRRACPLGRAHPRSPEPIVPLGRLRRRRRPRARKPPPPLLEPQPHAQRTAARGLGLRPHPARMNEQRHRHQDQEPIQGLGWILGGAVVLVLVCWAEPAFVALVTHPPLPPLGAISATTSALCLVGEGRWSAPA